jgi:hypothetical protein
VFAISVAGYAAIPLCAQELLNSVAKLAEFRSVWQHIKQMCLVDLEVEHRCSLT